MFEGIQSDIQSKRAYNAFTRIIAEPAEAMKSDMEADPNFDFSKWAFEPSKPSLAYEHCKKEFEFQEAQASYIHIQFRRGHWLISAQEKN